MALLPCFEEVLSEVFHLLHPSFVTRLGSLDDLRNLLPDHLPLAYLPVQFLERLGYLILQTFIFGLDQMRLLFFVFNKMFDVLGCCLERLQEFRVFGWVIVEGF